MMSGSLRVGNAPSIRPSAAVTPVTASKLRLTSGPASRSRWRTGRGRQGDAEGTYTVVVRDRSRIHNAHVVAPGYNRATKPLTFTGSQTWKVRLARLGRSASSATRISATMKGSAKIVR